jgi:flagellar protein FlgJ
MVQITKIGLPKIDFEFTVKINIVKFYKLIMKSFERMKPEKFIKENYPFALEVEKETKIPAIAILAQAALESGWGEKSIGKNIFGIKYRKGDPGFRKVLTTEYSSDKNAFRGHEVKSISYDENLGKYKFQVYQYFADYPSKKDAFMSHARLLLTDRYKGALVFNNDPKLYLDAIWRMGYATDPNYDKKMSSMVDSVIKRLPRKPIIMEKMKPIKGYVK